MTIENYREHIKNIIDYKSDLIFRNLNPEFISVVMGAIISSSKKKVFIFTPDFSEDAWETASDYRKGIEAFLDKNNSVIIFGHLGNIPENNFTYYLKNHSLANRIILQELDPKFKQKMVEQFGFILEYAVGDCNQFRLEYVNKDVHEGYCSFNNVEYNEILWKLYKEHGELHYA